MALEDRVRASVALRIQVFQYEPIEVGGMYETGLLPGETPKAAFDRAFAMTTQQVVEQLAAVRERFRQVRPG